MWAFEGQPDGAAYVAHLDSAERGVLLDLVDQVVELLGGPERTWSSGEPDDGGGTAGNTDPFLRLSIDLAPVHAPDDPALRRLLPDASREDPSVSAEFRRLTEADLRSGKVANLLALRAVLDAARPSAVVAAADAAGVAAALTDVRLVLSERLGIRTDDDADRLADLAWADGAPQDRAAAVARFLATLYLMLTALQDSLVELMLATLPEGGRPAGGAPGTRAR